MCVPKSLDTDGDKRRRDVLLEGTPWPNHPGHYSVSDLHIFFLVFMSEGIIGASPNIRAGLGFVHQSY
jgi:hypothetical protein